ncbi:hypothetical protein BDD21_2916 [Thiocapsa rosea]|uniref:Uncharacterized protein n=1 Tax=Thiocapsa rosea TaxID=69360 RepID=A0A495V9P9_9GAMM|nr:hypothetical protein BDD21_2916 [Thiocapsa rosea]
MPFSASLRRFGEALGRLPIAPAMLPVEAVTALVGSPINAGCPPVCQNSRPFPCPSALHADHLFQRMHHLDQVRLVGHDLVDVLVGTRNLVEHTLVLSADDPLGLSG